MPAIDDFNYIPSYEELKVPELQITFPVLKAASHLMGKYCDNQSKEFMLCRKEMAGDPRACLNEGKEVTSCGLEFLRKVKNSPCAESFTSYWKCLDTCKRMEFRYCRKYQAVFDKCVFEHLGVEKPFPGYFSKIRLHDTNRPRPPPRVEYPEGNKVPVPKKEPDTKFYKSTGFGH